MVRREIGKSSGRVNGEREREVLEEMMGYLCIMYKGEVGVYPLCDHDH